MYLYVNIHSWYSLHTMFACRLHTQFYVEVWETILLFGLYCTCVLVTGIDPHATSITSNYVSMFPNPITCRQRHSRINGGRLCMSVLYPATRNGRKEFTKTPHKYNTDCFLSSIVYLTERHCWNCCIRELKKGKN